MAAIRRSARSSTLELRLGRGIEFPLCFVDARVNQAPLWLQCNAMGWDERIP
jgi:hypothetical protein